MNSLAALFDIDNAAVEAFMKKFDKISPTKAENLRMYLEYSLMPRDSDDLGELSDSDLALQNHLERLTAQIDLGLRRQADKFLRRHVAKNQRPYTLNEELDEYIVPATTEEDIVNATPASVLALEGGDVFARRFWLQSNVAPRQVPCKYKQ